jgi:hypothetical protein
MQAPFVRAFRSELLKKRHSLAAWLVVIGAVFVPAIVVGARLLNYDKLPAIYSAAGYWTQHFRICWESVAIFFLPMGAILTTSLVTQIEFKNNAWKLVHTLPLSSATIYFAKLLVVLLMMFQFFVLFNLAIYVSAFIPWLLVSGVPYPEGPVRMLNQVQESTLFFIDCLPIVTLQYLLSVRFKNFLISVGAGFLIWITALGSLSWKFNYIIPFSYVMLNYLKNNTGGRAIIPTFNIHLLALGYASFFTVLGYVLFVTRSEKG